MKLFSELAGGLVKALTLLGALQSPPTWCVFITSCNYRHPTPS